MNRKLVAVTGALMLSLGACTPAQTASYNLSNDSDNFRVMRRVVFVNGSTVRLFARMMLQIDRAMVEA